MKTEGELAGKSDDPVLPDMSFAPPDLTPEATAVFGAYDHPARAALRRLRAMIYQEAVRTPQAGDVLEEVKWGQASYSTRPRTGTPIRLGETRDGEPALFVHCRTTLIAEWTATAGVDARVEGSRALIVDTDNLDAARPFIRAALTYRRKR